MTTRLSAAIGRYVTLTVQGVDYRTYFEEAGSGIPVVLQHTAGCDGRQWRHLLEDPDFTSHYRLIAPDIPYHGKSLPPESERWWETEYSLTKDFLFEFHAALNDALELDRPVYMGCSMGGHLAADLAITHPERYRAVIGIEAALHSHGMERILPWLYHPRISNDTKPALMQTLCSPSSPEHSVRETVWVYSQGAPPVFKGDLEYYLIEHDLTDTAASIDTNKVGMWVLSGEYDWSAPPTAGRELAEQVEGCTFVEMTGMGHFPMSEDPVRFKEYIEPILKEASAL
ncbi:alpha/beta fold hydrolase [Rhodococcus sp. NPDC003322]